MTLRTVYNSVLVDWEKIDNLPADTNAELDSKLDSVVWGTNVTIDNTDPNNPIINATWWGWGGQVDSVVWGTNITVDNTDPVNPVVSWLDAAWIKTQYESNADTNAYTDAEKTKLAWIETWAEVNEVTSVQSLTWDVTITDANLSTSDVTDNNASTLKHWFLPKLSGNSTQFLDGNGNYSTPAWVVNSYTSTTFTDQTTVVVNHWFWAFPVINVLDDNDAQLIPEDITHNSINQFTVTFNPATTWTIIASVWSPQAANLVTVPWNYTIQTGDNIIKATGLGSTITLPTAVWIDWIEFKVDNDSPWDIFIDTTWSETIQDEDVQRLPGQNSVTVYSDWSNWRVN